MKSAAAVRTGMMGVGCALACAWAPAAPAAPTLDPQSPVLVGGGGYRIQRPEIYHPGWIDLNKNGVEEVYEDPGQTVEARVDDLMQRMTPAEKIGQLEQQRMVRDGDRKDERMLAAGELGSYLGAAADADLRNRLQRVAVEESRLGIPLIFGFDTIHGFRTIFPIPLALSCSWDPELVERTSAVAAAESANAGIDWVFAPMVDIARDPRWGRIAEGSGEDPWLGSRMAAAAVRGFQGGNYGQPGRVAACLKHYVGYGAAEGGRDYNTTEIGLPTLRNIYLPPFRAGIDAGAATVMSAFNPLNGVPASANRFTLTEVLRDEWNFRGFVVSDWNAVFELIHQGYAADRAEAAELALTAGVDMEMTSDCYRTELPELIRQGRVSSADVDAAVRRILLVKFRKGLFDHPYTEAIKLDGAANTALARQAVAESCVLLKNDGTLPLLQLAGKTVALIGPLVDDPRDMLGTWWGHGRPGDVVPLEAGLAAAFPGAKFISAPGCAIVGADEPGYDAKADGRAMDRAVALAGRADLVILALGEPARWSGENKFRQELGLPGRQPELLQRIAAQGKPIVTILFAGRPLAITEVIRESSAVLMAWHPGVQAGPGIAAVLSGAVDPAGRLTAGFPRSVGQVPVYYDHFPTGRPLADYREGTRDPLFPFGYGLTYTRFAYGPSRLSRTRIAPDGSITATATVSNVGTRTGTEVVQLYLHAAACRTGVRPVRELKGFAKITLAPGEKREVAFTLPARDLGAFDADGRWTTEPGSYELVIASDAVSGTPVAFTLN